MNKKIISIAATSMFLAGCSLTIAYAENINLTTNETEVVTTTTSQCTDSDGINYFVKGIIKDQGHIGTFENYDRCVSKTRLLEYSCKNDAWYATFYECPKGCDNGICLEKDVEDDATDTEDEDTDEDTEVTEVESDTSTDDSDTTETVNSISLPDGTLVRLPDDPKVYVIQNGERVWIRTAEQFRALGYKWQDIKVISSEKIKAYKEKVAEEAKVVINKQNRKVYRLENGKLIWVPSVAAFNAQGLKWEEVTEVDTDASEQYQESRLIKDEEGNIYYITNSGKKILIISGEALAAYDKEDTTEEAVEVSDEVADSIEDVTLVKEAEDTKVYKLENGKKSWIKTADAFAKRGFRWEEIEVVDSDVMNSFTEAQAIE